jgi:hypothetical protein
VQRREGDALVLRGLFTRRELVAVIVGSLLMFLAGQYGWSLGHEAGCKRGWVMTQSQKTAWLQSLYEVYPDQGFERYGPSWLSQQDWLTFCKP